MEHKNKAREDTLKEALNVKGTPVVAAWVHLPAGLNNTRATQPFCSPWLHSLPCSHLLPHLPTVWSTEITQVFTFPKTRNATEADWIWIKDIVVWQCVRDKPEKPVSVLHIFLLAAHRSASVQTQPPKEGQTVQAEKTSSLLVYSHHFWYRSENTCLWVREGNPQSYFVGASFQSFKLRWKKKPSKLMKYFLNTAQCCSSQYWFITNMFQLFCW